MSLKQFIALDDAAIAAANRILARGDEVKMSVLKDGVRVSAVKYRTEYKTPVSGGSGGSIDKADHDRV